MMMKLLAFSLIAATAAASPPKGYGVVPGSTSPDGKLAVIAPEKTRDSDPVQAQHDDKLVELATGKVLASLVSPTAALHESDVDFAPRWSADGTLLEWYVDGKWGSYALVLVRVAHGAVTEQIDVRELAVHEVLADVQRTHPSAAAAAKREGAHSGWWFRDGLAIDVKPVGVTVPEDPDVGKIIVPRPALPLALDVTYTSNPKQLDSYPSAAELDGKLALAIDAQGKLARR
jgi:hypothetical protein